MTPYEQREAAVVLVEHGVSQRRACELLGTHRSVLRYEAKLKIVATCELTARLHVLASQHPTYGYRRIHVVLRKEGIKVNRKRVHRLWKQENLMLTTRAKTKKKRTGQGVPCSAERPNHVWTYDFIFDETMDGQKLKFLTLVDEFTREVLAIEVGGSFTSKNVQEVLERVMTRRGKPEFLRSDNGPEFIAHDLRVWLRLTGTQTKYIEPGKPWQNGFAESFHARFRAECLDREVFAGLLDAKVTTTRFRDHYNEERPHSALRYATPTEFRRTWETRQTEETVV